MQTGYRSASSGLGAMNSDTALRQEIRYSFNDVRSRIGSYTGLYSNEDLTREVLRACDQMLVLAARDPCLEEAKRVVEERCRRLAEVTDRFADRDPAVIAVSRAQAIAAVDLLQDAIFRLRRASAPVPRIGGLLRQRSP